MDQNTQTTPGGRCPMLYNPLLPEYRNDPHPQLHHLRSTEPVHWSSVYQMWIITRYADAIAALKEDRLSANSRLWENYSKFYERETPGPLPEGAVKPSSVYQHWMLQLDAPDHTRLRALVNKAFTPRVVETIRPRIQSIVDELLTTVEGNLEMDLVADLACPLPVRVIAELMGAPADDYAQIAEWSKQMLPSFGPTMSVAELHQVSMAVGAFSQYFQTLIAKRRELPGNTLLDALITATDAGDRLSDAELVATCLLLTFAGHATTIQLITGGIWNLLRHPSEHAKLASDSTLIASAVEEMLRYESPLQYISRVAKEDFDFQGHPLRRGQMLLISITAANRDPAQFHEPDRFDITRRENRHLSFGYSSHYCAGAPLARLEGQVAITSLLNRFPQLQLARSVVERERSLLLRGIVSLPLRLRASRCPMERVA